MEGDTGQIHNKNCIAGTFIIFKEEMRGPQGPIPVYPSCPHTTAAS